MSNKVCQICGQEKPAEAFSKSYPNRCRECVAEQARKRRKLKPKLKGNHAPIIITDDPVFNSLPDFLQEDKPKEPDWEQRRYDLALGIFLNYLYNERYTPADAANEARDAADQFINTMQTKEQ